LVADAVAAEHVAGGTRDVERLAARVALHDRRQVGRRRAFVLHAAEAQAALQADRDLAQHVGELLLHQLVGGERLAELLAVERVLAGGGGGGFWGGGRRPRGGRARWKHPSAAPSAPQAMP